WSPLLGGTDGNVLDMLFFDEGSGTALYVGGMFSNVNGSLARRVARWDGENWSSLAGGVTGGNVISMQIFDDGDGPSLFIGGNFTNPADRIARWNGTNWEDIGSQLGGTSPAVNAMAVFDDGNGPALYFAGRFLGAGGQTARNIVRWDGEQWSTLGTGILGGEVFALEVFDDGNGPALYAAGDFDTAGGQPAEKLARWDGEQWSAVPGGNVSGGLIGVQGLLAVDDGPLAGPDGPALYMTGNFNSVGGISINNIARFDGQNWSPIGSGLGGPILPSGIALALADLGDGPTMLVGGIFGAAGGLNSANIAAFRPNPLLLLNASPEDLTVDAGDSASFTVDATGQGDLSYQWRRDGDPLVDMPGVSGTDTATLVLSEVSSADAGLYDVVISDNCGNITSDPAELIVNDDDPGILGDLNNDGVVNVFDLLLLLEGWGTCADPENCPADLNNDGVVNVFDLLLLLENWG
ncbi:MAG: hypothetical protein EA377_07680, partial [Phycisphaerales bacterium]